MAIAYYIPDQAKLLAGSSHASRDNQNPNANSTTIPQRTSSNAPPEPGPAINRTYGTNINLTVPSYAAAHEPSGCWDFLTQVFCHALRFYHESSQIQPTVIQISVNFQSQQQTENPTATGNSTTSGNSTTATTTTTTTAAATQQHQQNITTDNLQTGGNSNSSAISTTASSSNSPTAHLEQNDRRPLKEKKCGRRKF